MDSPSTASSPPPPPTPAGLPIGAVERDTGLAKDTLRVWERRYGFPSPSRDPHGERLYPPEQVERLRAVKRLIDGGHRPGGVVRLTLAELLALAERLRNDVPPAARTVDSAEDLAPHMALLRQHDLPGLRHLLVRQLSQLGIGAFVLQVLAPLNQEVGLAWVRGEIAIFEEHLYTELVQSLLRQALGTIPPPPAAGATRVLLATVPGEPHGLGLLMAEVFFALEGCRCASLGLQAPVDEIVRAARAQQPDIVALGFSGCMGSGQVLAALAELRRDLPAGVALWAGGSAPVLRRRPTPGVRAVPRLEDIGTLLRAPNGDADSDKTEGAA